MDDCSSDGGEHRIMKREAVTIAARAWEESGKVRPSLPPPSKGLACCKKLPEAGYGLVLYFRQPKRD